MFGRIRRTRGRLYEYVYVCMCGRVIPEIHIDIVCSILLVLFTTAILNTATYFLCFWFFCGSDMGGCQSCFDRRDRNQW